MTNSSKMKIVFIWAVSIALTALLVTMLLIKLNNNKSFDSYSDLEKSDLVIKNVVGKNEASYYVFIYSSKDEYDAYKKQELEEVITRYATFARRNDDAKPLYLYDTTKFRKSEEFSSCQAYLNNLNTNINISDTPVLVMVTDGTVSNVYSTVGGASGIEATLVNQMKPAEGTK